MEELERQRQVLQEDADRKVRQVMREMEAQQRSALQEQKASLERAHAKALAFVKAEGQQTLELGVRPDPQPSNLLSAPKRLRPPPTALLRTRSHGSSVRARTRMGIFD